MSDVLDTLSLRARFLAAAAPNGTLLELGSMCSSLQRGREALELRLSPLALPLKDHSLDAACAIRVLRGSGAGGFEQALGQLLRAVRPEGRAVIGDEDETGAVGSEHALAVKLGWIPTQMEAIPELHPQKVRLFVIFAPPAARPATPAERGHKTH